MDNIFTSTEFYTAAAIALIMLFVQDFFVPDKVSMWFPVAMLIIAVALVARYAGLI